MTETLMHRRQATPSHWPSMAVGRTIGVFFVGTLILATLGGCASNPHSGRDLNAEAIQQMGYWGNDPGF